jgi:hypothetical protein
MTSKLSVSLIGSFRKYYPEVLEALRMFKGIGIEVLSPVGSSIIAPDIPFVRFQSDPAHLEDAMIQTLTMKNILLSDFAYVISPNGYIGKTTCYEIGRIIQAGKPIYFSAHPEDLPIKIPDTHILSSAEIIERTKQGIFVVTPLFSSGQDEYNRLERKLIYGQ